MNQKRKFPRKNRCIPLIVSSLNDSLKTTIEDSCISLNLSARNVFFLSRQKGRYHQNQRVNLQLNVSGSGFFCSGRVIRIKNEGRLPGVAVEFLDYRPEEMEILKGYI